MVDWVGASDEEDDDKGNIYFVENKISTHTYYTFPGCKPHSGNDYKVEKDSRVSTP